MWELTKSFWFEAAHTLQRAIDAEPSRRIHGHSYRAEVTLRGEPAPDTGMIIDFGLFEGALETVRDGLDHRFLDEVPGLGPPTMENLAAWMWRCLAPAVPGLAAVTIKRDSSGETCRYIGPAGAPP